MQRRLNWLLGIAALSSAAAATETTTFTYDALGRLVQSSNSGGPRNGLSSGTGYDPVGNRTASSTNQALPSPPANAAIFSITGPAPLNEGGLAVFTITKTGTAISDLTVNYATADSSAHAPGDYTAISGTLTFPYWATSTTVSVLTVTDPTGEDSEAFNVNLSSPSAGATIGTGSATATINPSAPISPPVANPDSDVQAVCTGEAINVLANDTDPEGNYPLVLVSATSEVPWVGATVQLNMVLISNSSGQTGTYDITYVVRDSGTPNTSATGTLTVTWIDTGACQ